MRTKFRTISGGRFRKAVKEENEDAILIGESWHDAAPWLRGDEFDGIMNYSFTKACIDFFANRTRTAASFTARLNELLMRNTDQVNEMMLDLLDSHDTERFLTLTGGDRDALILALAVLFFFPGMPCICYGTEIGMEGGIRARLPPHLRLGRNALGSKNLFNRPLSDGAPPQDKRKGAHLCAGRARRHRAGKTHACRQCDGGALDV